MWKGEGWRRTQRQFGVLAFLLCLAAEVGLDANIPIAAYSVIGGLLGLDLLAEAFDALRQVPPTTKDRDR